MYLERFIPDLIKFDTDPAARTHVRRLEVRLGCVLNERGLKSRPHGQPHGKMTVFVMIVHEHDKNAFVLLDKKCWRAVRYLFRNTRHHGANSPNAFELRFTPLLARAL